MIAQAKTVDLVEDQQGTHCACFVAHHLQELRGELQVTEILDHRVKHDAGEILRVCPQNIAGSLHVVCRQHHCVGSRAGVHPGRRNAMGASSGPQASGVGYRLTSMES